MNVIRMGPWCQTSGTRLPLNVGRFLPAKHLFLFPNSVWGEEDAEGMAILSAL
jgi:hypothetical protein